jgi:hypothetical protein
MPMVRRKGDISGRNTICVKTDTENKRQAVLTYQAENVDCQEHNDHKADNRLFVFGIRPLGERVPDSAYGAINH